MRVFKYYVKSRENTLKHKHVEGKNAKQAQLARSILMGASRSTSWNHRPLGQWYLHLGASWLGRLHRTCR